MGRATDGWLVGQVGLALVLTLVVCIGLGPLATTASWGFSDVPSDYWAYRWIAWLADLGLVAGYPDGTYQPENVVTRGQMAVFVSRAVTEPRRCAAPASPCPAIAAALRWPRSLILTPAPTACTPAPTG